MGTPVRYTFGVGTQPKKSMFADYPLPHPAHSGSNGLDVATYFNDFFSTNLADFTVANMIPTGTSNIGGAISVSPATAATQYSVVSSNPAFQMSTGEQLWYETRMRASAATGTYIFGLSNATIGNNGIYFSVTGNTIKLSSAIGNLITDLLTGLAPTNFTQNTFNIYGFYYDGIDTLQVYINEVLVAALSGIATLIGTKIPTAVIPIAFISSPTASEATIIDYVMAAQEVVR